MSPGVRPDCVKNQETPDSSVSLSPFWQARQRVFVSILSELSPLVEPRHVYLACLLESLGIEGDVAVRSGRGRKARDLMALARGFVVKACLGSVDTKSFRHSLLQDEGLRALCGFWRRVPSESTFSRAFASFARQGLGDVALSRLARRTFGDSVVMHVARDSTAIQARERPLLKAKKERKAKGRPGRKKGVPPKAKAETRQVRQLREAPLVSLADLPKACDVGTKRNSKGHDVHWIGFKFHVDVTDEGFPLSAATTSASVHDSQVAIPLAGLTAERTLAVCYQLMDAGYVGEPIRTAAQALGQVAIVAPKASRSRPATPLDPAQKKRYGLRSAVERFFSDLKDNRGGDSVRVKGHAKVHLHLMFGLLAVFGAKLIAKI